MSKRLNDKLLTVAVTIPAAGATTTSAALAVGQIINEYPDYQVGVQFDPIDGTALPAAKTITVEIQESTNGSTWATVYTGVITGVSTTGADHHHVSYKPVNQHVDGLVLDTVSYKAKLTTLAAAGASIASIPAKLQLEF